MCDSKLAPLRTPSVADIVFASQHIFIY